ncbi:MAG TPA: PIG-L deacetylase family protein [Puia sp.]|jgi:LmbE family N-acetylglucosaminyl deacetylase
MGKNESSRRKFVKLSSIGLGGMAFSPFLKISKKDSGFHPSGGTGKKMNILCVGAHPGDPEFGCGGTLARYSDAGHQVSILYLTRGEAGDPSKTFEQSAALRTKEAETACKILKARAIFAGQIDANTELNKSSIEKITKLVLSEKPDVLFTHWPVDAHPDHQVSGLLAFNAWIKSGRQFELYYYEVNTGSETLEFKPGEYVDITEVRDRKKQAMFAHKTQNPEQVYADFFKTMEEFRGLEAGVKAAEGFIRAKLKEERANISGL